MTLRISGLFISIIFILMACQPSISFDETTARKQILDLHRAQRTYHFGKDSVQFARQLSEHFHSVNRGKIQQPTYAENLQRYHRYFSSVEFVRWDDVSEPIIRFSDDGSLAYTIVDKEVVIRYEHEPGALMEETTHFAWVSIYRRYSDGWKIDCVASTNEPSIEKRVE